MPVIQDRGARRRRVAALLLALCTLSAAAAPRTFDGVISDSECGGSHADMRMGETDAECVKACFDAHGASYVLWDGQRVLALSDQRAAQPFAGRAVTVRGTLNDAGTAIAVESITERR